MKELEHEILLLVYNPQRLGSVRELGLRIRHLITIVRDRFSVDTWRILNQLQSDSRMRPGRIPLANSLALLNTLRNRLGDPVAAPLAGPITRPIILNERLFELFGESKRRQDLIRFGQYTGRTDVASGIVGGKVGRPAYYVLMPIPQTQVNANPLLSQNNGY